MPVIACKLPSGFVIDHEGTQLKLAGSSVGEDLENPSRNGSPTDNARRVSGYGLTEITPEQAEFFTKWENLVTYVEGDKAKGKLPEGSRSPLFDKGIILGPFKNIDEARKECASVASSVTTGFEGRDPKKDGVEAADDKKK